MKPAKGNLAGIPFMSWVFAYRSIIIIIIIVVVVVVVQHTLKKGVRRGEGSERYIMKEKCGI
jgi:hypothetical protein